MSVEPLRVIYFRAPSSPISLVPRSPSGRGENVTRKRGKTENFRRIGSSGFYLPENEVKRVYLDRILTY